MINDNSLDVKNLFGRPVPKYQEPAEVHKADELPQVPERAKPAPSDSSAGGLVAAAKGNMYALLPGGEVRLMWEDVFSTVKSLCQYGDDLYWVEGKNLITATTSRIMKITAASLRKYLDLPTATASAADRDIEMVEEHPIREPSITVNALCEFNGHLLVGSSGGLNFLKKGSSPPPQVNPYSAWSRRINVMCAVNDGGDGVLLCGGDQKIWTVEKDVEVFQAVPTAMCHLNDYLFYNDRSDGDGKIIRYIKGRGRNVQKAVRPTPVAAMCSDGKTVYDGGGYRSGGSGAIFDTLNDDVGRDPLWEFDKPVTAMAYVRGKLWEAMVKI